MPSPKEQSPFHPESSNVAEQIRKLSSSDSRLSHSSIKWDDHVPPELFLDRDGSFIQGYGMRFEKGFEGWNVGDRIRSRFNALKMIQADGTDTTQVYVAKSELRRYAYGLEHKFTLEGHSPEDVAALRGLGLRDFECDVKIVSLGEGEEPSKIRVEKVHALEEPFDGDFDRLEEGHVLVEGKVVEYIDHNNRVDRDDPCYIKLELPNTKTVAIDLPSEAMLHVNLGTIDKIEPGVPSVGDIMQIRAWYGDLTTDEYGMLHDNGSNQGGKRLIAPWSGLTYLVKPSEEREQNYHEHVGMVSEGIAQIKQQDNPQKVRKLAAKIVNDAFASSNWTTDNNLTRPELRDLREAVYDAIPDEAERPFLDNLQLADTGPVQIFGINKIYGVDMRSMNRQQFVDFYKKVASGELQEGNETRLERVKMNPFFLLLDKLPPSEEEELLQTAVRSSYKRNSGKRIIHEYDNPGEGRRFGYIRSELEDDRNVTDGEKFDFVQTMGLLAYNTTPETARVFIDLAKNMLEDNSRDESKWQFAEWMDVLGAIRLNVMNNINDSEMDKANWGQIHSLWYPEPIISVKNRRAAEVYTSALPLLEEAAQKDRQTHMAESTIELVKAVDGYLKETGETLIWGDEN